MMIKIWERSLQTNKGFTLVELMIVITIIGLLAIFLLPKVGKSKNAARKLGVEANMRTAMAEIVPILDNYTDPLELETAIVNRLDTVLKNPYKDNTAALWWYANGRGGTNQGGNPNAAVKTHYNNPYVQLNTIAQTDAYFAVGGDPIYKNRPECVGMVVIGVTNESGVLGIAIYGYDGYGNPITPPEKALRLTK